MGEKTLLYAVTSAEGDSTMVLASGLVEALDLWRREYTSGTASKVWPVSIALIHEGTILGVNR